jgi:hypothetical protein
MFKITQKVLILFLVAGLCVFAGSAGACENDQCPVLTDLVVNLDDDVGTWEVVGHVTIKNGVDVLCINVNTTNGRFIKKVAIFITDDPDPETRFEYLLDNKGKPKMKNFDPVKEFKSPVTSYDVPPIDISEFEPNPDLYIVVGLELNGIEGMVFARNGGTFDRYDGTPEGAIWGYYVTDPLLTLPCVE